MQPLRAETLQCQAQIVDLAKWKLFALAAVVVAALAWGGGTSAASDSSVLLLYCGGLLAAYVDALIYGRLRAMHGIAAYVRAQYQPETEEGRALKAWEEFSNRLRTASAQGASEHWAHAATSVVAAIALPLLAFARAKQAPDWRLVFPLAGLVAVVTLAWSYAQSRDKLLRSMREAENAALRLSTPPPIPTRTSDPALAGRARSTPPPNTALNVIR